MTDPVKVTPDMLAAGVKALRVADSNPPSYIYSGASLGVYVAMEKVWLAEAESKSGASAK